MAAPQMAQVVAVEFEENVAPCFYLLTFPLGEQPPKIIDPKALTRLYPTAVYDGAGSLYVRKETGAVRS